MTGMTGMTLRSRRLNFTAVLQAADYGPVIRCLIIEAPEREDRKWLEQYRFPGPVYARFPSTKNGVEDSMGRYYAVFPVNGPDIEWTMAYTYNFEKARNEERRWRLPGLTCKERICPELDAFIRRKPYQKNGVTLRYMDYLPDAYRYDRKGVRSTRKGTLPLIIWLHGLGEGGTDPTLPLLGNRVTAMSQPVIQKYFPERGAAVLVPQCPTMWLDPDGSGDWKKYRMEDTDGSSFYSEALEGLIRQYLHSHPEIDRDRIYIGGCSNGGFMTLEMLLRMPDFFAGAYPVCPAYYTGWMTEERIRRLARVPMWITAAATDPTLPLVNPDGSPAHADALYEKLTAIPKEERAPIVYSRIPMVLGFTSEGAPYEYMGHFSWIPVLMDQIKKEFNGEEIHQFEWLAAQNRALTRRG